MSARAFDVGRYAGGDIVEVPDDFPFAGIAEAGLPTPQKSEFISRQLMSSQAPLLDIGAMVADQASQAIRLAICDPCQMNVGGICKQCCGGVPIQTRVRLTISRCPKGYWPAIGGATAAAPR